MTTAAGRGVGQRRMRPGRRPGGVDAPDRGPRASRVTNTVIAGAHRVFVAPRSAWPLAFARILIGLAILGWSVSMLFDVDAFLAADSLVDAEFGGTGWRWFTLGTDLQVQLALAALIVASLAIIVGWKPTIWLFVAFVLLVSVQRRNTMILNSGDIIMRNLTLLLAFTPSGAALSLDRVRRHGRTALFTSSLVAPWGLRLVQLQIIVVYLFAFWSKSGELWRDGTAVSTVFRLQDLHRFGPFDPLVSNLAIVAFLTWSTLVVELALGTLLWAKRLRPTLIVFGVLLHLMIDTFVLVGFFGIAMAAGLMTFLDADRIDEWASRRRERSGDPSVVSPPGDRDEAIGTSASTV